MSPDSGIIDSHQYMQTLIKLAEQQGVLYSQNTLFLNAEENAQGFNVQVKTAVGLSNSPASN
jgi:L-2-hydroxyglutarate oxidase LhgO